MKTDTVPVEILNCDECCLRFIVTEGLMIYRTRQRRPIFCPGCGKGLYFGEPLIDDERLRQLHEDEQREAREAELRLKRKAKRQTNRDE